MELVLDHFSNGDGKFGKIARCKECEYLRVKKWKDENKEYVKKRDASYRKKNFQRRKEYNKKWLEEHPDWKLEWERSHREKNVDYYRDKTRRRRARLANCQTFEIIPKDLRKLYSFPCYNCGATSDITMDHVIPVSIGGNHGIGNLIPLCGSCNSQKGARTLMEWRKSSDTIDL